MGSKYTKRYSEEFKRDAIALVASSGRTVTEVARELGISSESLRGWVKKANGTGQASAGVPNCCGFRHRISAFLNFCCSSGCCRWRSVG
ncbi:transposase, partial [Streptomyces sp. NPDC001978]|uniref:transposase n=1 Tax=Streptomyces sp. NPDC001978 TaxID=3364627 RepID=UPI0036D1171C